MPILNVFYTNYKSKELSLTIYFLTKTFKHEYMKLVINCKIE